MKICNMCLDIIKHPAGLSNEYISRTCNLREVFHKEGNEESAMSATFFGSVNTLHRLNKRSDICQELVFHFYFKMPYNSYIQISKSHNPTVQ